MFTAILWDYDGTLANTPVKNIAVTRAVLGRLDPALLDPLPEALSSLAAYQAANYRWRNWRELYQHALRVPADRLDEAGALWGPCQLADRTLPPLFGGLLEVLPRLAALAPMGICSQNDSGNIRAALAAHGAADCFAAVVGHADVDFARQKPDPAAFLACLDRLGLREGRFAYIGDHAGDIAFGRNAQAALRAMGRAAEVVCVAAAWGGAPSVDLAAADAVSVRHILLAAEGVHTGRGVSLPGGEQAADFLLKLPLAVQVRLGDQYVFAFQISSSKCRYFN